MLLSGWRGTSAGQQFALDSGLSSLLGCEPTAEPCPEQREVSPPMSLPQGLPRRSHSRPYHFLLLPMVDPTFCYAFDRRTNQKVLLVAAFSSKHGIPGKT